MGLVTIFDDLIRKGWGRVETTEPLLDKGLEGV